MKEDKPPRLISLDALRGVIMITMALDHANTFISHGKLELEFWAGRFPNYGDNALQFLTRFVTHLSAPGFFFLMGASMVLFAHTRRARGWTEWEITRHFFARGLLLVALQLFVENPAWNIGSRDLGAVLLGVLYGLGTAMIVGALLLRLSSRLLVVFAIVLTLLAHALVADPARIAFDWPLVIQLLTVPGPASGLFVLYPTLPWLALALFGMVFGRWLLADRASAYRRAATIGFVFLLLFAGGRALGGFGNIRPAIGSGWIAFLNVVKYPPSLVFTFFTLGVDLLLLAAFARVEGLLHTALRPVVILGQNALFFYLVHLYLYGLVGLLFGPRGTTIAGMYPYWLLGLLFLAPLCWWYGDFKHSRAPESVWRFF